MVDKYCGFIILMSFNISEEFKINTDKRYTVLHLLASNTKAEGHAAAHEAARGVIAGAADVVHTAEGAFVAGTRRTLPPEIVCSCLLFNSVRRRIICRVPSIPQTLSRNTICPCAEYFYLRQQE